MTARAVLKQNLCSSYDRPYFRRVILFLERSLFISSARCFERLPFKPNFLIFVCCSFVAIILMKLNFLEKSFTKKKVSATHRRTQSPVWHSLHQRYLPDQLMYKHYSIYSKCLSRELLEKGSTKPFG